MYVPIGAKPPLCRALAASGRPCKRRVTSTGRTRIEPGTGDGTESAIYRHYEDTCATHLTAEAIAIRAVADERALAERTAHLERDPACWSWPLPDPALPAIQRWELFHARRCAICDDGTSRLVDDHDHVDLTIRGLLCAGCNASEGRDDHPIYIKYRRRPPSLILGRREEYDWFPFPRPPAHWIEIEARRTIRRPGYERHHATHPHLLGDPEAAR